MVRVTVVDDNPAEQVIINMGVEEALDGATIDGFLTVGALVAGVRPSDMYIVDYRIPGGCIRAIEHIRRIDLTSPIIVYSGMVDLPMKTLVLAGATCVIRKPGSAQESIVAVAHFVRDWVKR